MKGKIKHDGLSDMGLIVSPGGHTESHESFGRTDSPFTPIERVTERNSGFFFDLLENAPDSIFGLAADGVITYLNPAFEILTGWKRNQWIGRPFSDLFIDDTDRELLNSLESSGGDKRKVFYSAIRLCGGGSLNAEISVLLCRIESNHLSAVGSIRDNSGRKRSDEAHKLQEKRIRSLYEISADPGMGIDAQIVETLRVGADMLNMEIAGVGKLTGKNCMVLYCHDETGRVVQGYECDLSKTFCKITLANDNVVAIHHVGESEYKNEEFYKGFGFESYIGVPLRVDGKVFGTLNFASSPPRKVPFTTADMDFIRLMGRWIGTMIERKRADDMLKEKEKLYRTLVENANDLIIETSFDGRFLYVSSNHKEMLGYEPEELLGLNSFDLMHPDDRPAVVASYLDGFRRGTAGRATYRYKHKNGEWRWHEATGKPFRTSTGEIRAIVDARDITERKKIEDEIQESLTQKESLLREIHHRVKNNLQVISSLLSLQSDYAKDEESLARFYESQSRISTIALIHEKLYQSRNIDEIKMLDYITDLTRNLLRVYKELGDNVDVQINAYDISIDIDRAIPCGLIINELFSNCLKHAFRRPENEGMSRKRRNKITVEINSDSEGILVLTVRDNGVGFPMHLNFRNTDTLGLQLVTTLADQLRGTIELVRANGTSITIVFPLTTGRQDGSGDAL